MSSVEIVQKEGKKPEYKHYVNFLGHYKNGKKDDHNGDSGCGSFSLTSSSNNSSSSINSDFNDAPKRGFKEYLEGYHNKKYNSVQPNLKKNQNNAHPTEHKIVKTEVFIEINNTSNSVSNTSKLFEKPVTNNNNRVSEVSKMFEKNSATDIATKTVSSKVNQFKSQIVNGPDNDIQEEQKKVSIGDLSKKFENNQTTKFSTIEKKIQLKKQPSISEKSKVFEETHVTSVTNNNKEIEIKKQIFNEASQVFKQKDDKIANKTKVPLSPKPQINKIEIATNTNIDNVSSQTKSNEIQTNTKPLHTISIPSPPPPPPPSAFLKTPTVITTSSKVNQELSKKFLETETTVVTSPPTKIVSNPENNSPNNVPPPPPPPPLPPIASIPSAKHNSPLPKPQSQNTNNRSGYNTLPRMQKSPKSDNVDGITTATLDKNDPRVKKLVYGALRGMYGAYHDKANDYLATLPKNRVRKNNGLDSIIDSIKSQGGLEKLNGRANPTAENE